MGVVLSNGAESLAVGERSQDLHGSWPRPLALDKLKSFKERTMSEPIMSPRSQGLNSEIPKNNYNPGPGPPATVDYKIPLSQNGTSPLIGNAIQVPVIFVLGGPGSGKMTHCNHLTRVLKDVVHLNMMDTFIEMVEEYGSKDITLIPAYRALEALMSNVNRIENATAIIVTSYPRNMRDVVEYLAKIQRVDGVVLIEWNEKSLEKQVKMGTQNGAIDAELARAELKNYRTNIIPVAEFFDQQGLLHLVAGQRPPAEVFEDLVEEVGGILAHPVGGLRNASQENGETSKANVEVYKQRRDSMESVDAMIEEELKNSGETKNGETPQRIIKPVDALEPQRQSKSITNYPNLTKDVEDILAAVQTSNLLEKAAALKKKK